MKNFFLVFFFFFFFFWCCVDVCGGAENVKDFMQEVMPRYGNLIFMVSGQQRNVDKSRKALMEFVTTQAPLLGLTTISNTNLPSSASAPPPSLQSLTQPDPHTSTSEQEMQDVNQAGPGDDFDDEEDEGEDEDEEELEDYDGEREGKGEEKEEGELSSVDPPPAPVPMEILDRASKRGESASKRGEQSDSSIEIIDSDKMPDKKLAPIKVSSNLFKGKVFLCLGKSACYNTMKDCARSIQRKSNKI